MPRYPIDRSRVSGKRSSMATAPKGTGINKHIFNVKRDIYLQSLEIESVRNGSQDASAITSVIVAGAGATVIHPF